MHINKKKILKWIILRQLKQFQHNFSSKKCAGVILFEGSLLSHLLVCQKSVLISFLACCFPVKYLSMCANHSTKKIYRKICWTMRMINVMNYIE